MNILAGAVMLIAGILVILVASGLLPTSPEIFCGSIWSVGGILLGSAWSVGGILLLYSTRYNSKREHTGVHKQ